VKGRKDIEGRNIEVRKGKERKMKEVEGRKERTKRGERKKRRERVNRETGRIGRGKERGGRREREGSDGRT
jgi:hypothetical protein